MNTPLRRLLADILFDDTARAEFGADADTFLLEHGWTTLEGAELEEALAAISDAMPVETAQAIDSVLQDVDFSGDSLAVIGADLANASSELSLEDTSSVVHTGNGTYIEFGAGADTGGVPDDHHEAASEFDSAIAEAWDTDAATQSAEADLAVDAEGIDIDQSLVHDVSGADGSETEFDLEESGIDDLDT